MATSEAVALAAHLHVLRRRKTGRVTDTEWMASNADYAREVLRIARAEDDVELDRWADRFEAVMFAQAPGKPAAAGVTDKAAAPAAPPAPNAYRGRLR